ncbi:acid protease [Byssothecium circinans]|uniref:Acid protease n=1 Tax=Byssothecium circinans TaxID=147558 RepID=A0A6A5TDV6_9PLEO|nr:acid protease [Byssothecium circinans]
MAPLFPSLFFCVAVSGKSIKLDFQVVELSHDPLHPRDNPRPRALNLPLYNDFPHQPPTSLSVLLDTGSTDLWLPSHTSPACAPNCPPGTWDPSAFTTAIDINIPYNATFGSTPDNPMLGKYYNDTVSLGGVDLANQTFALAEVVPINYNAGHWGILGMGSKFMSSAYMDPWGPVYHDADKAPLPVWLHLYDAGVIEKKMFSVWLNAQNASTGSVLFGGVDESKFEGGLMSTLVLLQRPARLFTGWFDDGGSC